MKGVKRGFQFHGSVHGHIISKHFLLILVCCIGSSKLPSAFGGKENLFLINDLSQDIIHRQSANKHTHDNKIKKLIMKILEIN